MDEEKPEKVVKTVKRSRKSLSFSYSMAVLLFLASLYFRFIIRIDIISALSLLVGVFILAFNEFGVRYKELVVSNKRTVLKEGFSHKHSTTINYDKIIHILVTQNLFQKMVKCGNLVITTEGAKRKRKFVMDKIRDPLKVKKLLEHFMFAGHKL